MDALQIKYDALQANYEALRVDLKQKDKIIDALTDQNTKLQAMIETYETNSRNSSLDSGSTKSVYDKNLEMINESVTEDEYKFMEDLNREKQLNNINNLNIEPQSNIIKKAHTDAEEEYFFLTVLSCKIDLATKGCSNAAVSDVEPQILWNRAQEQSISMHQFHDWIMSELLKVFTETQSKSTPIAHKWNTSLTHQSKYKSINSINDEVSNSITMVDPQKTQKYITTFTKSSPRQMKDEEQILSDEDESDFDYL